MSPMPASQLVPLPSQLVPQWTGSYHRPFFSTWGRVMCQLDIFLYAIVSCTLFVCWFSPNQSNKSSIHWKHCDICRQIAKSLCYKKCDSNCIGKKYHCKKLYEHSPRKKHRLIFVPTISKDKMIQERMNCMFKYFLPSSQTESLSQEGDLSLI